MFVGQEACTFLYFVFKSCLMWIMWSLVNVMNICFSVHSNLGNERISFVECQVSNCSALWWRKQVTFEWTLSVWSVYYLLAEPTIRVYIHCPTLMHHIWFLTRLDTSVYLPHNFHVSIMALEKNIYTSTKVKRHLNYSINIFFFN
jgi:hypothetical protein